MQAYHQGKIDYFCAIYAIINAVRIAAKDYQTFNYKTGCSFFQYMMHYCYDHKKFLEILYHGTSIDLMSELLQVAKKYLNETYNLHLHYKFPFKTKNITCAWLNTYIKTTFHIKILH